MLKSPMGKDLTEESSLILIGDEVAIPILPPDFGIVVSINKI